MVDLYTYHKVCCEGTYMQNSSPGVVVVTMEIIG